MRKLKHKIGRRKKRIDIRVEINEAEIFFKIEKNQQN